MKSLHLFFWSPYKIPQNIKLHRFSALFQTLISAFQAKVEDLSALDVLSGEFVASSKASGVHAPVPPPSKKPPEVNLLV